MVDELIKKCDEQSLNWIKILKKKIEICEQDKIRFKNDSKEIEKIDKKIETYLKEIEQEINNVNNV